MREQPDTGYRKSLLSAFAASPDFGGGCGVFIMMSEFMRYGIGMRNLRFILWKGGCEVSGWA